MPQHQPTSAKKAREIVRKGDGKFTEKLRNQRKEQERRHSREQWPVRWTARNGAGFGLAFGVAIGRAGDRDVIVSGFNDGTVRRWDAATGDPIGTPLVGLRGGSGPGDLEAFGSVWSVAAGRVGDRDVIVSGCGDDGEVDIWKAATRGLVRRLEAIPYGVHIGSPVHAVAIGRAGDRDVIAAGSGDGLWIWDVTGDSVRTLRAGDFEPCVWSVAVGRVGCRDVIVSGSADGTRRWDAATGDPIGTPLTGHLGSLVKAVAIGRAGDRDVIVSGFDDGTVQIWDAVTGDLAGAVDHDSAIHVVAIGSAGGRDLIVSGHRDGTVTAREHHRSQQQP